MTVLLAGMCCFGYAQDYLSPPKANEKVLGSVSLNRLTSVKPEYAEYGSEWEWHRDLLKKAEKEYPGKIVYIREMRVGSRYFTQMKGGPYYYGPASGKVVYTINPEEASLYSLSSAIDKAIHNVPKSSRMAIDQIMVTSNMDREKLKDQIIDVLLDKGYKVVAKEYLQKLYNEQQDQLNSGLYNPDTTVEGSKFSAVGYFINVKVTETSIRVQVVNVSTGEYEGNATVNF